MSTNPLMAHFTADPLVLASPGEADRVTALLALASNSGDYAEIAKRADTASSDDFWPQPDDRWGCRVRPYVIKDGILQIPVKGVLLHNFPYALGDWATGYEYIWQAFKRGCGDFATGTIKGIALIEDTPGGMVAGCFDAVDKMVALKQQVGVPVRAFAHEAAYSAGYAIATVADHIAVSRTGGVGSIGVVTSHMDVSGALDKMGIKITFIASDPSKVEGNPYQALSAEAKARIQARIDELYGIFVTAVSRSRGLEEAVIRDDLKAYCYTATQAVSNGLADSIGSLEDAVSAFAGFLDDQSDNDGDETMANPATDSAVDQAAAIDAAREEGRAEGHATGLTEGAAAERTRIGAILGSDEAKGREAQALYFATKTGMSAEDAIGALAVAPKVEAPAPAASPSAAAPEQPAFVTAMEQTENPDVGAGAPGGKGPAAEDDASDIVALAEQIGLKGFAKRAA